MNNLKLQKRVICITHIFPNAIAEGSINLAANIHYSVNGHNTKIKFNYQIIWHHTLIRNLLDPYNHIAGQEQTASWYLSIYMVYI